LLAWGSAYGARASCCKTACLCELIHRSAAKPACGVSAPSCSLRGADAGGPVPSTARAMADPAVVAWTALLFLLIAADRRLRLGRRVAPPAPFRGVPHPPPWRLLPG